MPNLIGTVGLIEFTLVVVTIFLMTQPRTFFRNESKKRKSFLTKLGVIFLCLTFFWSVVFGFVYSMNGLSDQF